MVILKESLRNFEDAPEGVHTAVCYQSIDLGTITDETAFGIKTAFKILLAWELSEELMQDGRPFSVRKIFRVSINEKATFQQMMTSWRGKRLEAGFNTADFIGMAGNIAIAHEPKKNGEGVYTNITSITPLKKSEKAPPLINPGFHFDIADLSPESLARLPEWIQKIIITSDEYHKMIGAGSDPVQDAKDYGVTAPAAASGKQSLPDDEVPF